MRKKRELAIAVISLLMIAFALSACGSSNNGGSVPPHEEAWLQAYYEVQSSGRPSKAYQAIDYTRSLYFDGHASLEQTQQRIYMILEATPALRLSTLRKNQYVWYATQPHFRHLSAREIYRRYFR